MILIETKAKEKTALNPSVGADERQSLQTSCDEIIPADTGEFNSPFDDSMEDLQALLKKIQAANDPTHLHTVTMNELLETVYQSRPAGTG